MLRNKRYNFEPIKRGFCIECKKPLFGLNKWKIRCLNWWKIEHNIVSATPRKYYDDPKKSLDDSDTIDSESIKYLKKQEDNIISCNVCDAKFFVISEERKWRLACVNCYYNRRK